MSEEHFEIAANNHAREPVPNNETVSGNRMALIIVGIAITLPAFLIGAEILSALGTKKGLLAVGGAGAILALLGAMTMTIAARTHLATGRILIVPFGTLGAKIISSFIGITLLGWFGFTVSLFGQACVHASIAAFGVAFPEYVYTVIGGLLMISITIFGFKAMDLLSRIAVPILILLLVSGTVLVLEGYSTNHIYNLAGSGVGPLATMGVAMSALVGGFMVGVTTSPDYARFAKSGYEGAKASILSYGLGYQAVLILAGMPALVTGSNDFIGNLAAIGLGAPALFIVIFATLTTNVSNLYSTSLGFAQTLTNWRDWVVTLAAGSMGTLAALAGIMDHFVDFLLFLGMAVPPICGIYLTDYYLVRKNQDYVKLANEKIALKPIAFIAWGLSFFAAWWLGKEDMSLSSIAAVDAILIAGTSYMALMKTIPNTSTKILGRNNG